MELNLKIVFFQAVLLAVQGVSYLLIQHTRRPVHDMKRAIDEKIPFLPGFIFAYVLWYPLIAIFPVAVYHFAEGGTTIYQSYVISIITDIVISLLVYWYYPTGFRRPMVTGDTLPEKLLRRMYVMDYKGLNCMPSMHCSQCFIILYYCFAAQSLGAWAGIAAGLALLITVSTVFTKQHVLVDVLTAIPLAGVCIFAGMTI